VAEGAHRHVPGCGYRHADRAVHRLAGAGYGVYHRKLAGFARPVVPDADTDDRDAVDIRIRGAGFDRQRKFSAVAKMGMWIKGSV